VDFFVRRGLVDPDAEPESPFEEAVYRELTKRGYKVRCQVGVAGYRIDLVILSEDEQQFDLGIECDGWTFHISPAARDRDWLRQSVLGDLGWTIHRVWSTAWIRDPEAEIAAIEGVVSRVRGR
jgi:very-short-patch-repair endonuclease